MSKLIEPIDFPFVNDNWRLQPIINAQSGEVFGYEMLTRFLSPSQAESYFRQATSEDVMMLFESQQEWVGQQTHSPHRYFCNLPVEILKDADLCSKLMVDLDVFHSTQECESPDVLFNRCVVELQDPEVIPQLSDRSLHHLNSHLAALREQSVSVWIDDVTQALLPSMEHLEGAVDGIKIDKETFWHLADCPSELKRFIARCKQICALTLIEGIETALHCEQAIEAGADFLQGYFWPELSSHNNKVDGLRLDGSA
ncbi:EAL domain-containing protein [Hafnia alvei]|uniref:EAL domain-containing protein n=1 Tax=Hafnia alvei TaxID=569 RepID=UPI000B67610A|nr:EAL domain-containing protein [Hafnia alvei]MBI0274648.1 EAL domain-containing protein [Hafnia alvei]PNK99313.1 EAL domain-containing protein [Hafnia alvei]